MQFKNLQINGFGKLEDVNINLKNGLNLILGDNESGKSTFTEFIKGILYGVSRNKNGKEYSDYEKFKPWNDKNFSGKLVYTMKAASENDLNNNLKTNLKNYLKSNLVNNFIDSMENNDEEYVVYRDFNRNNAKIYNKNGVEITSEFNKDKARGAEIGFAHLGMDEDTFDNSVFIKQKEIKVNELSQNAMLQKLTNIIQSGEEDVSYEATIKKLEKILLDEVGTDRTQNKPKNILKREITDLEITKTHLINNRIKHEEIERKIRELTDKKKINIKNLNDVIKVFNIKNKYEKMIQEQKSEFDIELKVKKEQRERAKKEINKKKIIDTLLISVATIVLGVALVFTNEILLAGLAILVGIASLVVNLKVSYKEELQVEADNFDVVSEEIRKKENRELENLEKEGVKKSCTEKRIPELKTLIEKFETEKNNYTLEEHKLKIEDEALTENLENLLEIEEELSLKNEKLKAVLEKEEIISFAINKLEEAYTELKEEVIPDIENDIRYTISKTTNGQYSKVRYNDQDGLVTENKLGDFVTINRLSAGTIDQMYLGFRMAIADKYNNVPIIFDEAFVFCDDVRLEGILKTLSEMAEERQIIILSCSDREQRILQELGAEFNEIRLEN